MSRPRACSASRDRRLSGGVAAIARKRALRHRPEGDRLMDKQDMMRDRWPRAGERVPSASAWRQRQRGNRRPQRRQSTRDSQRRETSAGDLRHAGHADISAGRPAARRREARLLQSLVTSIPRRTITTRSSPARSAGSRIDALSHVRESSIKGVLRHHQDGRAGDRPARRHWRCCCNMAVHPESVPINLQNQSRAYRSTTPPNSRIRSRWRGCRRRPDLDAAHSVVRLSAGRQYMTDELQALCFLADCQFDLHHRRCAADRTQPAA